MADEKWSHLPLVNPERAEAARLEATELEALTTQSRGKRYGYYLKKSGPGWMQSAMTLGGGSAIASLSLGASFGFELLWIQPLAMLVGIIMLAAHAHQTLSTGRRPFNAMAEYVHPLLAWGWVLATLISTVIWDFPQFALAAGMAEDIVKVITGWQPEGTMRSIYLLSISVGIFVVCTAVVWNYNRGLRGVKIFDRVLKGLIWLILMCFLVVIVRATLAGEVKWGAVLAGFIPNKIPTDKYGVTTVMAAFGSAVGINMTFLFGYSLLARGWGRAHRGLAKFDLLTGMFLPYVLATSLMVMAAAITLHGKIPYGSMISPVQAAETI
ncbi:MAG TPA: divalent metal cation transporter, partial [Oceanipulchritudo sp.]|nr:divalent metal cation transporter [Oceanipulchritudo sp.]